MPGPVAARHKLPQRAGPGNEKVRRNLSSNALKVGVGVPVKLIGKKTLHIAVVKLSGRQADGVNDDQVNLCIGRARAEVGRSQRACIAVPAALPQGWAGPLAMALR